MFSTILVVDEDVLLADTLVAILNSTGNEFFAVSANTVEDAIQLAKGIGPALVLLAAIMPDAEGLNHAVTIRDECGCKVLLMSWYPQPRRLLSALGTDIAPFEILAKPIPPRELLRRIRQTIRAGEELKAAS